MEFGLSHVIIALVAFALGWMLRRKPNVLAPSRATMAVVAPTEPGTINTRPMPPLPERLFKIVFTGAWLVGWTAGVVLAAGFFMATLAAPGFHTVFLGAWLVAAGAAWVHVSVAWVRMLLGHPEAFQKVNRSR